MPPRSRSGEREIADLLKAQDRPTMRAPALTAMKQFELDKHLRQFLDDEEGRR